MFFFFFYSRARACGSECILAFLLSVCYFLGLYMVGWWGGWGVWALGFFLSYYGNSGYGCYGCLIGTSDVMMIREIGDSKVSVSYSIVSNI
ncbi:hypothetical protein EV426DRAFT_316087 [Tirmania nivea]|nr:hypothetical protein EV426DRAFT_316087 [Tirmania nivea]